MSSSGPGLDEPGSRVGAAQGAAERAGPRFSLLACAAIVIVSSLVLSHEIGEPFWGIQDFNCLIHSIAARNLLKYGFVATHFMPALDTGDVPNGQFTLYVHHPPAITYFLALFYGLFGQTEWAGRLFFVLCAIGSALLVFFIGQLFLNRFEALACALVFSLLPCVGYYGRMIDHESPGLFFGLLAFFGYCRFLKTRSNRALLLLYLSSAFGLLTSWQDYSLPFVIALHYLFFRKLRIPHLKMGANECLSLAPDFSRVTFWKILLLPLLTAAFFVALLTYSITAVSGGTSAAFGGSISAIFKLRIGSIAAPGEYFTFVEFLSRELGFLTKLFTPVVIYAAAAWLVILVVERLRGRRDKDHFDWLVLCLFAYGALHVLVFKQQA